MKTNANTYVIDRNILKKSVRLLHILIMDCIHFHLTYIDQTYYFPMDSRAIIGTYFLSVALTEGLIVESTRDNFARTMT